MTSTWDRLGNISAAIIHLQKIKKKVAAALETAYRNTGHTTPDTSDMPKRVAGKVASEGLQDFEDGRINNDRRKPTKNILMTGEAQIKSSTLATFNKKLVAPVRRALGLALLPFGWVEVDSISFINITGVDSASFVSVDKSTWEEGPLVKAQLRLVGVRTITAPSLRYF